MKILHNTTLDVYIVIDEAITFQIGQVDKGIKKHYAVVIGAKSCPPSPVAYFDEKEDATKCLKKIVNFFQELTTNNILEIEDKVTESLLIAPDSVDKNNLKVVK